MTQWHLILEGRCPSRLNMATDLALFKSVLEGNHQGAIRIYNWDEPAVTAGFHQSGFTPCDPTLCIPVVKRPTGGGAVLHSDDITFCIAAPESGPFSGILGTCRQVSSIFRSALIKCGLDAEMQGDNPGFSPVCFMRSSPVELCLQGEKIMGLALLRKNGHILVQGVMPLTIDEKLSLRVFGAGNVPGFRGIHDHSPRFSRDEFIGHLLGAFSSLTGISLLQGGDDDNQQHDSDESKIYLGRQKPRNNGLSD